MGRHKSTSAAGTAKEKKVEQRCKQRPQGAEPLKAQISSLIYKGTCVNRQPHQQGNPRDAPPVPEATGFCSPQHQGGETHSLPLPKNAIVSLVCHLDWKHGSKTFTPRGICCRMQPRYRELTAPRGWQRMFPHHHLLFCSFLKLCFPRTAL